MTISVVIADDEALIRSGLQLMLESQPDLRVVAETDNGHDAVDLASSLRPDVILMDIQMPRLSGIDATRRVTSRDNPTRVIMLTTFGDDENIYDALQAGASGFLLKDSRPEEVINAIRAVAAGDALLSPAVTKRLVDQFVATTSRPEFSDRYEFLTDREKEVLSLVAEGLSNQEIADRLFVSFSTAKTHVSNVLTKLGLRDRVHAVIFAYQHGLVEPPAETE
ncbi:MAG: response regulator transcription factor [Acidobacteria bacterium]|nr:MAG: response regulator transcription factor [Acidobacteriota bacterium]